MVTGERAKQVEVEEPDTAIVHHRRVVIVPINADVVSRTPGFSQQKERNVRSKVFNDSVTSGNTIAPGRLGNIVSVTICETSS